MLRSAAFPLTLLIAAALSLSVGGMAAPARAQEFKFTGAGSCGASNCHGSTKPRAEYPRLNESVVWFQKERHAKAYETLTNEKLKSGVKPSKIAQTLKIAKAETSDRCLSCHAVNVKPALRGPKFDITEGVHCDGCHGPAEKWLEPHAEKGWTHEQSVKLGMYDTKNLLLRAEKCVSCHLQIDQELVSAGHPDLLAYELDTFSALMPPHWRDKGTWFTTSAWTTGQAISLREAMKQLAARASGNAPAARLDEAWSKARGTAAVFRHALPADGQKELDQSLATLADLIGKGASDRAKIAATANEVAKSMDQVAAKMAAKQNDKASTRALLQNISGDADNVSAAGVRAGEQAAMALDRLYAAYSKSPGETADKAAQAALDKLFSGIEDPAKFNAKQFATDMKAFRATLK